MDPVPFVWKLIAFKLFLSHHSLQWCQSCSVLFLLDYVTSIIVAGDGSHQAYGLITTSIRRHDATSTLMRRSVSSDAVRVNMASILLFSFRLRDFDHRCRRWIPSGL